MASRKLILSSLRLSSSSPRGYFFNRVTEYCSVAAPPSPPQTFGKKERNIIEKHKHEHGVGCSCRCMPTSSLIEILKRKTGRDDIDKEYIVAMISRQNQLSRDIFRKLEELKEKEFGSDVEKNRKLMREMIAAMCKEFDNNNKVYVK